VRTSCEEVVGRGRIDVPGSGACDGVSGGERRTFSGQREKFA